MTWQPLHAPIKSLSDSHPDAAAVPATFGTPVTAWAYGAFSDAVETDRDATIRIQAKALSGKIGLCLMTEDCGNLASAQHLITPADGDATVNIAFEADKSPARLLVRNYDDEGKAGEVEIKSIDISFE